MKIAITEAAKGIKRGQTPFGACIVKDGKLIAASHNKVWAANDITAHAEIDAIRKACKKLNTIGLSRTTIYSTCEPCPMCFAACHWAKISRIVYGTAIKDAKTYGFNELVISSLKMKKCGKSQVKIDRHFSKKGNQDLFRIWKQKGKAGPY